MYHKTTILFFLLTSIAAVKSSFASPINEIFPEVTKEILEHHKANSHDQNFEEHLSTPALASAAAGAAGWAAGEKAYEMVKAAMGAPIPYNDDEDFDLPLTENKKLELALKILRSQNSTSSPEFGATPAAFASGAAGGFAYKVAKEVLGQSPIDWKAATDKDFDLK